MKFYVSAFVGVIIKVATEYLKIFVSSATPNYIFKPALYLKEMQIIMKESVTKHSDRFSVRYELRSFR